jgi:hypothetical protein
MKVLKKNVYYCDFCKKRSLSGGHLKKHEVHCTLNPDRECKFCKNYFKSTYNIKDIIEEFKTRFKIVILNDIFDTEQVQWLKEPITLEEIRKRVNNCPNCIFSIIRQCKLNYHYFDIKFDYKKEVQDLFNKINDEAYRLEVNTYNY